MRSYHDPIEVRRGLIGGQEVPEQFVWRQRLWVVREIISHWIETGAWWEQPGVAELFGTTAVPESSGGEGAAGTHTPTTDPRQADLLAEREFWRVDARRGRTVGAGGVFDLGYDHVDGLWHLVSALD